MWIRLHLVLLQGRFYQDVIFFLYNTSVLLLCSYQLLTIISTTKLVLFFFIFLFLLLLFFFSFCLFYFHFIPFFFYKQNWTSSGQKTYSYIHVQQSCLRLKTSIHKHQEASKVPIYVNVDDQTA